MIHFLVGGGDHWMGGGGMGGGVRGYGDNYERGPRTLRTVCGEEGTGHRIHMRGLPFRATEDDIADVKKKQLLLDIV